MRSESAPRMAEIDPAVSSSWDRTFITFDIDWAHDEVLQDTIALVSPTGVPATWFVTHDTPGLELLRRNKRFELGLHPNFNRLIFEGHKDNAYSASEIVEELLALIPEARVIRSHSVTQSSRLTRLFQDLGITHESNDYIPHFSGVKVKPWRMETGMIKAPYFFSDELWTLLDSERQTTFNSLGTFPGLRIFDFHPIHVFLNTENLDRYERTRHLHYNPAELIKHRYEGYGTRSRLLALLKSLAVESKSVTEQP